MYFLFKNHNKIVGSSCLANCCSPPVKSKDGSCLFNPYCYPCDCAINCFVPSVYSAVCCIVPCGAVIQRDCRHKAEFFMTRRPLCCKCCQCACYFIDLFYDCNWSNPGQAFHDRRSMYNENGFFVYQNKIVLWDKEETNALLRRETGRGHYLGATNLVGSHLPYDSNGRESGLLTIGGLKAREGYDSSDHAAYRKAFEKLTWAPDCIARVDPRNETMMKITSIFEKEIKSCNGLKDAVDLPLKNFLIRSLHWGLLELDLSSAEVNQLFITHFGGFRLPVLWHLAGSGWFLSKSSQEDLYSTSAEIYYRSPKLKDW